MNTYKRKFIRILEDNTAGAGGVFGSGDSFEHGGAVETTDFYAPGDARTPKVLGSIYSRTGMLSATPMKHTKKAK